MQEDLLRCRIAVDQGGEFFSSHAVQEFWASVIHHGVELEHSPGDEDTACHPYCVRIGEACSAHVGKVILLSQTVCSWREGEDRLYARALVKGILRNGRNYDEVSA